MISEGFKIKFIDKENFEKHVLGTLKEYNKALNAFDLKSFNKNIVDPIKLLFDKNVFRRSYEEIIMLEVHRQRDKSNSNLIGYFHQNMFQYIKGCQVPKKGWDVVYYDGNNRYYIEMKNKHNTMNSSSSAKTYMRMQNHLLNAEDRENSICALVEVIASKSQDIEWVITLDNNKQIPNPRLRRISIDKFYEIVTGDKYAFKSICEQLPITIEELINKDKSLEEAKDTVIDELKELSPNMLLALYKLAFSTYEGFEFSEQ